MGTLNVKEVGPNTDIREYRQHLFKDLSALEFMIKEGMIEEGVTRLGAEQELCLVDMNYQPATKADEILADLQDDHFTTELAKFNLEINLDPLPFEANCLALWQQQLDESVAKCQQVAEKHACHTLITGILPTIRKSELELSYMTDRPRYHALNRALYGLRNSPYEIHIQGIDELRTYHDSVMFESCNTSFQVHYQVGASDFRQRYNWAQAIAAPVLAVATNSPLFLGKRLWQETRIALFQQATDTRAHQEELRKTSARVHFGESWLKGDLTELIKSDISTFRPLVIREGLEDSVQVLQKGGIPKLKAYSLFNGTVYRWNRPCYGITNQKPHLRIENRYLPAGPSTTDEVANGAFWLGLMHVPVVPDVEQLMEFDTAKENFRAAARQGLSATFKWLDKANYTTSQLILDELLPKSREGLMHAGVDEKDIDKYLDVIEQRAVSGRTGSSWILSNFNLLNKVNREEASLLKLTEAMTKNQKLVGHEWPDIKPSEFSDRRAQFQRIDQIMSKKLFTVGENDHIDLVPNVMKWNQVRHMLVEDQEGRLKGIVTLGRLGKYYAERDPEAPSLRVKDIMNDHITTVTHDTPTREAVALMIKEKIGCLPVVNTENKLVGIVTEQDFLPIAASYFQLGEQLHKP